MAEESDIISLFVDGRGLQIPRRPERKSNGQAAEPPPHAHHSSICGSTRGEMHRRHSVGTPLQCSITRRSPRSSTTCHSRQPARADWMLVTSQSCSC